MLRPRLSRRGTKGRAIGSMAARQSGCGLDFRRRARPISLRGLREYIRCAMAMQQVAVATHPECRDLSAQAPFAGDTRPQLRPRRLFGCSQEPALAVADRECLSIVRTRHGPDWGNTGMETTKGIAADEEQQRREQTSDDSFEVRTLPWQCCKPRASVFHGHPSTTAFGISRTLFPLAICRCARVLAALLPGGSSRPALSRQSLCFAVQLGRAARLLGDRHHGRCVGPDDRQPAIGSGPRPIAAGAALSKSPASGR